MATFSDAQVFGSTQPPPAAPRTFSDAEMFPERGKTWLPIADDYGRPVDAPPPPLSSPYPQPASPPVRTPWTEDNPAFAAGDPREALPPTTLDAGKIGGAMAEGWRATPPILTPEAQAHPLMQGFLGTQVYGPALSALGGFLGAGNALMYGGAELANQVTGDPRAGRDALMIAQVAPMAGRPGPITRSLNAEPGGLSWRNLLPQDNGPPLPGPRVAPLMETFNRMDAARAAERAPPDRSWPLRIDDEPQPSTQAPSPPPEPPATDPTADYAGPPGQPPPGTAPGPTPEPPPIPPSGNRAINSASRPRSAHAFIGKGNLCVKPAKPEAPSSHNRPPVPNRRPFLRPRSLSHPAPAAPAPPERPTMPSRRKRQPRR